MKDAWGGLGYQGHLKLVAEGLEQSFEWRFETRHRGSLELSRGAETER